MRIIYLPPYSPDFNPIEEGFSAMKAWIRRNGKDVRKALKKPESAEVKLRHAVFHSMTPENLFGWYHHSGYL
jgi:transposase